MHHENVLNEIELFLKRRDAFSLGVGNGCQLMMILGWVGRTEAGLLNK